MKNSICIRVDHYCDGKMVPISLRLNDLTTKSIRSIKRVWRETDIDFHEIVRYSCLLSDESTIILSYKDGRWNI